MIASSMILKGPSYVFFRDDCGSCAWVNLCLRASAFSHGERQYFLSLRGYRGRETAAMLEGKRMHEEAQAGVLSPDEFGMTRVFSNLEAGREVLLREAPVCSRTQGLRGDLDLLSIRKVVPSPVERYRLQVTELKRSFRPWYVHQPVAYGLILSDPNVELIFHLPSIRTGRLKTIPRRLYAQSGKPLVLDVDLKLHVLGDKPREYNYRFMAESSPSEWAKGMIMAVRRKMKWLRRFHKPGLYYLQLLKYCRWCRRDEEEECGFWRDICSRHPYQPLKKSRPAFFGRRNLLVRSKPHIKLDVPISFLKEP